MSCFHEEQVEARVKCPLIEIRGGLYTDPLPTAKKFLQWAVLEAFNDRLPSIQALRTKFEWFWMKHSDSHGVRDKDFYAGIRAGNTAARKVYLLLQEYRVLRPYEYYLLHLGGHTIDGSYAVLAPRSERVIQDPLVLVERSNRPHYDWAPGPVELLRHQHFTMNSSHAAIWILNFPLYGRSWIRKTVDVALVRRSLVSILDMLKAADHASPGSHCRDCATKRCLGVFSE